MMKWKDWRNRAKWILFGITVISFGFAINGCTPNDSPMPEEEVPIPQEEPIGTP